MNRKQLKKLAFARLKKCYWMIVVLCLILAMTGIDYVSSMSSISTGVSEGVSFRPSNLMYANLSTSTNTAEEEKSSGISFSHNITSKLLDAIQNKQNENNNDSKQEKRIGIVAVQYTRGVLAQLVNSVSSNQIVDKLFQSTKSILKSKNAALAFFIFLSLLFWFIMKTFVLNIIKISLKRVTMELSLYDKVPMGRFLYLFFVKRIWNVVMTMLLTDVYSILWLFTIVGGVIKGYSYQMVPYIIAENPSIAPNQAITLSRRMMDGHKWEAFKLNFSFIGWNILDFLTYGISGILYSNPYKELTKAKYYSYIRKLAKENHLPDADLLNDEYLHKKADFDYLQDVYSDVQGKLKEAEGEAIKHTGFRGFLENVFGLTFCYDEDEAAYQDKKAKQMSVRYLKDVMEQNMYPFRLFAQQNKEHQIKLSPIQYERHYAISSILFLFFSISFVGWCWEVSLHLISDGTYTNRGFFHGPWLPIYGFGGILILILLYKFREKPFAEFFYAILLCGCVEYFTAWYMETTHGGTKWWDYTGYFLNIHGRVCAEGLLVFGLGGLAIVYLLAPFLDNHFRKIPKKIATIVLALLLILFGLDVIYSSMHPNVGDGITNYVGEEEAALEEAEETPQKQMK